MGELTVTERAGVSSSFGQMESSSGVGDRAMFAPANMAQAMELSDLMAGSNFVPKHLRGKPGDCLAVIMQAARWGMDPFAVGNKTFFVNDRIAYEAQLVAAVVNSSRILRGRLQLDWKGSGDDLVCVVVGYIVGDENPKVREVAIKPITVRNSPLWKQDPQQQLGYYTQRAWARLYTPEVILGVYTPEEVQEMAPLEERAITGRAVSLKDLREQSAEVAGDDNADRASLADDAKFLAGDTSNDDPEQGRADAEHGDQHDGATDEGRDDELEPSENSILELIELCGKATSDKHITFLKNKFMQNDALYSLEQIERFQGAFDDAKARVGEGA